MGINVQSMGEAEDSNMLDSQNDDSEMQQSYREELQTFPDGRQIIQYFLEEGPPATIMEVNSNEYGTESQSVAGGGDITGYRLSPFNKDGYFKYPVPVVGLNHRQTMHDATIKKLETEIVAKNNNEQLDGSSGLQEEVDN